MFGKLELGQIDKPVKFGFGLCILGLLLALTALLPSATPRGSFPWLVVAGSAVYLPGAFLAFLSAKGKKRNQIFVWLRLIRVGFFVVLGAWMYLVASGSR